MKILLKERQNEANYFYSLKNELKSTEKSNSKVAIIRVDYEKKKFICL
jgi:hypothetical protein